MFLKLRPPLSSRRANFIAMAVTAALYVLTAEVGLLLAIQDCAATALWPPAGIALAALLLFGPRLWPGVWVGAFLANVPSLLRHDSEVGLAVASVAAFVMACSATATAWLAATVLKWLTASPRYAGGVRSVGLFILVGGILSCMAGAALSSAMFCLANPASWPQWLTIWLMWWLGDTLGVMLFTPLILAWAKPPEGLTMARAFEAVACFTCLCVLTFRVFGDGSDFLMRNGSDDYIILPVIVWAGLKLGYRGVTAALLIVAVASMGWTMVGYGPFGEADLIKSLMFLGMFLACLTLTGLCVAAVVDERKTAEAALSDSNTHLEERVRMRTEELGVLTGRLYNTLSEQSATLQTLTDSQARLNIATSASKIGYWEWNIRTGVVDISPQWLAQIGFTQEEALKVWSDKIWRERLHPDDAERVLAALQVAVKSPEGDYSCEFRLRHKDGTYRDIYSRGKCFFNAQGEAERMIGCHVDVTESRQAQRSVSMMRHLVDQVNDCIEIVDARNGRFMDCNQRWCEEHGYTREEALKLGVLDVDPNHTAESLAKVIEHLKDSDGLRFETTHRRKDGSEFPVELSATFMSGEPDRIMVILRNISERKSAEQALQNNEQRLRLALEVADVGSWDWDLITGKVVSDAKLDRLFVGNDSERLRVEPDYFRCIHPEDMVRVEKATKVAVEGDGRFKCAFRVVWPDATVRWLEGLGVVHRDVSGRAVRMVGVTADITERLAVERRVRTFATLAFELNKVTTYKDAARLVARVAGELIGWDAMVLVAFNERTGLCRSILNMDTVDGTKQEVVSAFNERAPSLRMKKTIEQGAELVNRSPESQDGLTDFVAFGDRQRRSNSLMFVPIRDKNMTVGMLSVQSYKHNAYSESDLITLQSLADECASALQRIASYEAEKEAQARLAIATSAAKIGNWDWDMEANRAEYSEAWCAHLGYAPGELSGDADTWKNLIHPEDRARVVQMADDYANGLRTEYKAEMRMRHKSGGYRWILSQGKILKSQDGRGQRMVGCHVDITESKESEVSLRESRELFVNLVNTIDGIVWEADVKTFRMTFVSSQALRILGYPLGDWLKNPTFWSDHIHPEDREYALNYCVAQTELCRSHDFEYRMIAADGRVVWMRDLVSVSSRDSKPHTLRGIMVDITQQKMAEEALRESETHFKALFDNAPDAVFLIGLESEERGKILSANRAAAEMHGYSVEELTRMTILQLDFSDDIEKSKARMNRLLEGERQTFEIGHVRKDGVVFPVEVTAELLVVSGRRFILAFDRDITERKVSEKLLAGQKHILELIASGTRLQETLNQLCIAMEEQCPESRCTIMLVDEDGKRLRYFAGPGFTAEYRQLVDGLPIGPSVGSCGTAAFREETVIVEDVSTDPLWAAHRDLGSRFGFRACWSTPVLDASHKVIGTFAVYKNSPGKPTDRELHAFNSAKDTAAIAIEKDRVDNQLARSREDMRRLSANLVEAQESERRHLARELHDEVGQTLTATKILLQGIRSQSQRVPLEGSIQQPSDSSDTSMIFNAVKNVDQMLQIVRNLSLNLRPPMLDDFGLVSALRWLLDQHIKTTGRNAVLDADYLVESPDTRIETACFRIVQEALTNISRHSKASRVVVTLKTNPDNISLKINDDGVGFNVSTAHEAARLGGSLGLLNLHERAVLVGGSVQIVSSPGNGTQITATFPLATRNVSVTT